WLYAKHTIFYDALPNYFLEFDIMDRETGIFLDTPARHKLLKGSPVESVPVLGEGSYTSEKEILKLIGQSKYITVNQRENLYNAAVKLGLSPERNLNDTDLSGLMEGLYIKVEENGMVVNRMKYVRAEFLQQVDFSETHWIDRPIIPNQLAVK
ncbi:MAG: RNA ligase family protein, partial [Synergistaceae bacterium]|nr:RNA ligase family protein [Synergistaceae bacterium]